MRRCCAILLVCGGCSSMYAPFMADPGDGGIQTTGGSTGGGGKSHPDLSTNNDDLAPSNVVAKIIAHSSTSSFVSVSVGSDGCTRTPTNGCTLIECPVADMAVAGSAANLGQIAITGTLGPVMIAPQMDGRYLTFTQSGALWGTGAQLTFTSTGGSFAPLTAMVAGPTAVTITLPLAQTQLDVPRSSDFNLTWNGGTNGGITWSLAVGNSQLTCDFPRINDAATVSHLALAQLPAGSGTLAILDSGRVTASDGADITAETPALDSNGVPFLVPANVH
jgi:hypothetical protein